MQGQEAFGVTGSIGWVNSVVCRGKGGFWRNQPSSLGCVTDTTRTETRRNNGQSFAKADVGFNRGHIPTL